MLQLLQILCCVMQKTLVLTVLQNTIYKNKKAIYLSRRQDGMYKEYGHIGGEKLTLVVRLALFPCTPGAPIINNFVD